MGSFEQFNTNTNDAARFKDSARWVPKPRAFWQAPLRILEGGAYKYGDHETHSVIDVSLNFSATRSLRLRGYAEKAPHTKPPLTTGFGAEDLKREANKACRALYPRGLPPNEAEPKQTKRAGRYIPGAAA